LINQLFKAFKAMWPAKFRSKFDSEKTLANAKRAWLKHLPAVTPAMIERSLQRCHRELEWPPELKEFMDRTRESLEDMGVPDSRSAYAEACRAVSPVDAQRWSHPVVYHTGCEVGWHYLRSNTELRGYAAWRPVYERNVKALVKGEKEFPAPNPSTRKALEEIPLPKEENRKRLAALRAEMFD